MSETPAVPRDWYADVLAFHRRFRCHVGTTPAPPDYETSDLRRKLILEEVRETLDAITANDLPGLADGIADSIYVLLGTAIAYGIDLRPVFAAVHAANMAKVGGGKRDDGKIEKPPGWSPPDVAGILERQPPLVGDEPREVVVVDDDGGED